MMCASCTATLALGAAYCGQCGTRVRRRRASLIGLLLDGRFLVEAKIAAGGFAAVYRATRVSTRTPVALKVLHHDLALDRNLAARFRREAAALSKLRDAHTVTTYEFGEAADGTLFIVMELLRGTSLLAQFQAQGALPWRRMLAIALGVCSSLSEAHRLGIVHRDLKPANIHLEPHDFVKVLDFGIAKVLDGSRIDDGAELTRTGQAVGTIEYMSPEQLVGSDCDGRTDVYTLGIVIYEMITGRRPFAAATSPASLVTALMTQTPVPPSALGCGPLPPGLDGIILRCLERDPSARFATIDELASGLERVLVKTFTGPAVRAAPPRITPPTVAPATFATFPTFGTFATFDDDEITTVDPLPPQMPAPPPPMTHPHVVARRTLPRVRTFAVGSSIEISPNTTAPPTELWLLVLLTRSTGVARALATLL